MSVLYTTSEGNEVVLGKIAAMYEGKGRAEGRKVVVALSYIEWVAAEKKEIRRNIRVDFWNSKDLEKPQLADRIRKLTVGESIVCLIRKQDDDYTALAYRKRGIFTFNENTDNEVNILIGSACAPSESDVTCKDGSLKHICKASVPIGYDDDTNWYDVTFWSTEKRPAFANTVDELLTVQEGEKAKRCVIVCGKKSIFEGITKDNIPFSRFNLPGFRLELLPSKTPDSSEDMNEDAGEFSETVPPEDKTDYSEYIVKLGTYKKKPQPLHVIAQDPDVLEWLEFIATKWDPTAEEPEALKDQVAQKKAIKSYLKQNNLI